MFMHRDTARHALGALLLVAPTGVCVLAGAATINFSGPLLVVEEDLGGAVYSGVPLDTVFTGAIDDVTANGFISDGTTRASFGCCIAAGGLDLSNDVKLDAETASSLNTIAGSPIFNAGDTVDGINLEGDELVTGGNRLEIGLSYILTPNAFDDDGLNNYPPNPDDILLVLFFILEENGGTIYSGLGRCTISPDAAALQLPGDCNQDGGLDLSDAVCFLDHLFAARDLPCGDRTNDDAANRSLMDANGDGNLDLSDVIWLLSFLFSGGQAPVPGVDCRAIADCPDNSVHCR